ncbi:polyadenylate-binding protein-interacting protein 12-like [Aristolochia californica]|uniref:polyadenylate-binding protein-interacting protein 12-like n=1 Tax=Aristolochia californica TaxID=171875 RepID=UPI0035D6ABBB
MAVVENAGVDLGVNVGSSSRNFDAAGPDSHLCNELDQAKASHLGARIVDHNNLQQSPILRTPNEPTFQKKVHQLQQQRATAAPALHAGNHKPHTGGHDQVPKSNGMVQGGAIVPQHGASSMNPGFSHVRQRSNGVDMQLNGEVDEGFKQDIRDLQELLSNLNPMAEEFVPPSLANNGSGGGFYTNNFMMHNIIGNVHGNTNRRKKNNYSQGKRRMNSRTSMAQREEIIRRTVYVSDIDQQVTEEQLAALFINCGQVVDCRVCGDPNSVLRFAFIEFTDEEGARAALSLAGTMLGYYPVRVLPSKTAIAPVNPTFLPRSEDEREMCARTIYCTNIDKKVSQADVRLFFESICGEVYRLRLLGDYHHSTRIAFVEFVLAESAIAALNCSGVVLGSLPIRVSPSKTPVRPRSPRPTMH